MREDIDFNYLKDFSLWIISCVSRSTFSLSSILSNSILILALNDFFDSSVRLRGISFHSLAPIFESQYFCNLRFEWLFHKSYYHVTLTPFWDVRESICKMQAWPWLPFRMFSPEYFCTNHRRFTRKVPKISETREGGGGRRAAAPPPLPQSVRLLVHLFPMGPHGTQIRDISIKLYWERCEYLVKNVKFSFCLFPDARLRPSPRFLVGLWVRKLETKRRHSHKRQKWQHDEITVQNMNSTFEKMIF